MKKLYSKLSQTWDADSTVARLTLNPNLPRPLRSSHFLITQGIPLQETNEFAGVINVSGQTTTERPFINLGPEFSYLGEGDIAWHSPRSGRFEVIYRKNSSQNHLFVTGRCNSKCIMCPQPPIPDDDPDRFESMLKAISLVSRDTVSLGITGGEPTLLGAGLIQLINSCQAYLPDTVIHLLTNGHRFKYSQYARELSFAANSHILVGIPLYSDIAGEHDFICQVKGAFTDTIRGLLNLHRATVPIELRFVLQAPAKGRIVRFARFVAQNLPFVSQVSFMGVETVGFAEANRDEIWIDPMDLMAELEEAVGLLNNHHICVALFNQQLCVLPRSLWPYSKKSISDWKNEFPDQCTDCSMQKECGGFFALKTVKPSRGIRPIPALAV